MERNPDEDIAAKSVQSLTLAVQLLEVAEQRRARYLAQSEADDRTRTGQLRAEHEVARSASRVVTAPVRTRGDEWCSKAELKDLAKAWWHAAQWADNDPAAEDVAARVETEFRRRAPEAMDRYDAARRSGDSRGDAMRPVVLDLANEAAGVRVATARTPQPSPDHRETAARAGQPEPAARAHSRADERTPRGAARAASRWARGKRGIHPVIVTVLNDQAVRGTGRSRTQAGRRR